MRHAALPSIHIRVCRNVHQYQGGAKSPQRIDTQMSRDDFGEIAASRMSRDMPATSSVEIVVPSAGGHLAVSSPACATKLSPGTTAPRDRRHSTWATPQTATIPTTGTTTLAAKPTMMNFRSMTNERRWRWEGAPACRRGRAGP